MSSPLNTDGPATAGGPEEPHATGTPPAARFGRIGIAAVAGALAASRPDEADGRPQTPPRRQRRSPSAADVTLEDNSYERSGT